VQGTDIERCGGGGSSCSNKYAIMAVGHKGNGGDSSICSDCSPKEHL